MKTNLASLKAEHAGSSSTISHLEATIRDKDKHIEILQGQRQRSGEETDEELGRVKRAHEKLEGRLASLREQLSDKEVQEYNVVSVRGVDLFRKHSDCVSTAPGAGVQPDMAYTGMCR